MRAALGSAHDHSEPDSGHCRQGKCGWEKPAGRCSWLSSGLQWSAWAGSSYTARMLHKVASTADPERIAVDHLRAALAQLRRLPHRAYLASVIDFTVAALQSKEDFGEMLHRRRKAAGWSPEELAEKVGLAPNTIRNIENGKTTPAPATLALLLGLPELQLVAEHVAPPAPANKPNAHFPPGYDPAALAQVLRAVVNGPGGPLEQSYLYLDNQSATDYLAVCEAYASTRGRLFAELQRLGEQIATDCRALEIVAIGSGDGRAEVCLARALADAGLVRKLYLLDISHTLLAKAYEHAALAVGPDVEVEAVHGNFHDLACYSMIHASPGRPARLYTLLGATVANLADELRFFANLHSCAASGDLLLLDFRTAHEPPRADPSLQGTVPKINHAWHAGLLLRNNSDVRSVTMRPTLQPGRIPGSYIVAAMATATMADGSERTYRVMDSSRYNPEALSAALAGAGWKTVHAAPYEPRTALMLLRRM